MNNLFLPVSPEDMKQRGWTELDFLLVNGDAYVDHPSFGAAIIGRLLEQKGFRVGMLSQPDWRSPQSFTVMGRPRLAVLVTAGNLDSMLNRYTAAKRFRSTDSYSPGGRQGCRPERATIVYCQAIRRLWKDIPIVIGGIEASLRRFAHYDYWSDAVRPSILVESQADLLVYGMGEKQVAGIADLLSSEIPISEIRHLPGTCYTTSRLSAGWVELPSFDAVANDKKAFAQAFKIQFMEQNPFTGKPLAQKQGEKYLVQNPPARPLTSAELDNIYELPYTRNYHPVYAKYGGVPAIEEVKFSIVSHRGCFGACSFCAIGFHQGRIIQFRSRRSIIEEAKLLTRLPDFKGYIHDVGGPTANFRHPACDHQSARGACRDRRCLYPSPCPNLNTSHAEYLSILRELRALPGVKKVFIRSGIRFDYLMAAPSQERTVFLRELCEHHVSGQLKVAPEHVAPQVTKLMGKPGKNVYLAFMAAFQQMNRDLGKEQYLVPYFMSSHPGAGLKEAIELAEFLRDIGYHPEQVQEFIPTPGSLSTCMYYTGIDPLTGQKVHVAKGHERKLQRALLQFRNPKNWPLVREALIKAGREDLIGFGGKCLVKPAADAAPPKRVAAGRAERKKRFLPAARNKKNKSSR